jgi:hypothetical protein
MVCVAVYESHLAETLYCHDEIGVDLISEKHLFRGQVSHSPYNKPVAYSLRNNGTKPAISLHVYGASFDRLGTCELYLERGVTSRVGPTAREPGRRLMKLKCPSIKFKAGQDISRGVFKRFVIQLIAR